MPSDAVRTAVAARLAANWSRTWTPPGSSAPEPVATEGFNVGANVPDDNAPFLSVEYPVAAEEQVTIGSPGANVYRETGAIRFVLAIPANAGLDPFSGWLEALRTAFRGAIFGGLETFEAPPAVLDDRNTEGAYFLLAFAVPYRYDLLT